MRTRNYSDLLELIQALCGVVFASIETGRINALANRRANRAYRASDYWTRFLVVGEERAVSNGVIPFDEGVLRGIDTFLRIHKDLPNSNTAVQEFYFSEGIDVAKLVSGTLDPSVAYVTYKAVMPESYGQSSTEIPAEWFQYLAHGTYADYLRAEGQQEKAALADQEANEILTDELMRAENVSTQNLVATRFLTNANMQMRYT
jgi:hypothetical protein